MAYAQWNPLANYIVGDVVLYNALAYQAIAINTGAIPPSSPASWQLFGGGGGAVNQWSTFPAVSDVNMANFDINNAGEGTFDEMNVLTQQFVGDQSAAYQQIQEDQTLLYDASGGLGILRVSELTPSANELELSVSGNATASVRMLLNTDTQTVDFNKPVHAPTFQLPVNGPQSGAVQFTDTVGTHDLRTVNGDLFFKGLPLTTTAYNSFFSNTTQLVPTAAETPITYDVASFVGTGVSLVGIAPSSQFRVTTAGVYRILFSAQFDKAGGGGSDDIEIYLRINGTNVANTASRSSITANVEVIQTVSLIQQLAPTDTVELVAYTATGTQMRLSAIPAAPPVPAIPSIITDVQRIA